MGTPLFIVTANLLARQRVAVGLVKSVWASRRLSEAAARAAAARLYGRRLAEMAQQTLEQSVRGKKPLSAVLKRELEAAVASNGADRERAERALAEALAAGMTGAAPALTPEQRALAERLRGDQKSTSLEEWLQKTLPEADAFTLKAEKAIEELSMVAGEEEVAPLTARYRGVLAESDGRRRHMLADTFVLDVGRALVSAKANAETLRALELNAASLSLIATPQAKALARRASVALTARDTAAAEALIKTNYRRSRKGAQGARLEGATVDDRQRP